mmetsp:Transcript_144792/g.351621  ORF Transcript_144792/g.351621 Transcript_144792/m.351621 type:complete len:204 (+) Transcript_144792:68-679(+)
MGDHLACKDDKVWSTDPHCTPFSASAMPASSPPPCLLCGCQSSGTSMTSSSSSSSSSPAAGAAAASSWSSSSKSTTGQAPEGVGGLSRPVSSFFFRLLFSSSVMARAWSRWYRASAFSGHCFSAALNIAMAPSKLPSLCSFSPTEHALSAGVWPLLLLTRRSASLAPAAPSKCEKTALVIPLFLSKTGLNFAPRGGGGIVPRV